MNHHFHFVMDPATVSTFILQKKGPFAKVWLAAHWDKKLTKADIRLVDISETVVNIVKPAVPMALRTSGELMLGVVKIYTHKVRFLLKEAQDATMRLKTLEIVHISGRIDMPAGRGAAAALLEPERTEFDDALPQYQHTYLMPDQSFTEAGPPQLPNLGDLDDWFQVVPDQTFEESQQDAFFPTLSQPLRGLREPTPSDVSSVVSSTEKLRRATPNRLMEMDMAVQVPVDELDIFGKPELPVPLEDAPLPEPFEMVTPARAEGEAPGAVALGDKVDRPKKKVPLAIDKHTVLSNEIIKARLADTSDIVQTEVQGALDCRGRQLRAFDNSSVADRFLTHGLHGLASAIEDVWQQCVRPAEAVPEVEPEVEGLRRESGRPSHAPGEEFPDVGPGPGGEFPPAPEGDLLGPQMDMDIPGTPASERKRKAQEEAAARKRARHGSDLAATVHETLAELGGQFETKKSIKFSQIVQGKSRTVTATKFYDLLVLKSKGAVEVKQPKPLADITITPTEHFGVAILA